MNARPLTVNRCPGCGVSAHLRHTGDKGHTPDCPWKRRADEYNAGLRERLARGRARAEQLRQDRRDRARELRERLDAS